MGPSPRGGAYTYDWIENLLGLDMHSVDRVLPEFQHPEVGDTIGYGKNRMRLERVEPERVIAWRSEDGNWVWTFVLTEHDGKTRLISRNRFRLPTLAARIGMLPMEPASLLMERKMLLGIKQRAEALALVAGVLGLGERLVLDEAALDHRPREDADEAAVLDHRHALEVVLLQLPEPLLERHPALEREVGLLRDLAERRRAWVAAGGHHLADEGLAGHDPDELLVPADEDRAHLRAGQELAGLLRARRDLQRRRLGHHRLADERHG